MASSSNGTVYQSGARSYDPLISSANAVVAPFFILISAALYIVIAGAAKSCGRNPTEPSKPVDNGKKYINQKYHTVLVGSFASKEQDKANAQAAELRRQNINNFVLQNEGNWLVCVGQYYGSDERAKRTVRNLARYNLSNTIILYPKSK